MTQVSAPATVENTELVDSVTAVLDIAIVPHYDRQADETFIQCKLCNEWEGHTDACPVPSLELWLREQPARS